MTNLPLLPLRDIVVFPDMIVPLFVGREKSVKAIEEVMKHDTTEKQVLLVTQKDAVTDNPKENELYKIGILGNILQMLKLPDGTVKVLVEGKERVKLSKFIDLGHYIKATYTKFPDKIKKQDECKALTRAISEQFEGYIKINKKISKDVLTSVIQSDDPTKVSNTVAAHLNIKISDKQMLLETDTVDIRLEKILELLESELDVLKVEKKIRSRVKRQMEKTQREYYLNEQLKAIQKELGEIEDGKDETTSLNKAITKAKMPKEVEKKCLQELKKLKNMSPMSAEATVVRNYLDWMTELPWHKKSEVDIDLTKALNILDKDHFGLEKVKERIIEFLAVQKRMEKIKGPILCLEIGRAHV